jgi:hypothetical protein
MGMETVPATPMRQAAVCWRSGKGRGAISRLAPMTYETADQWLDYIDPEWIEDDKSVEALLRAVSDSGEIGEPSSDENTA